VGESVSELKSVLGLKSEKQINKERDGENMMKKSEMGRK